ncbi:YkgJ family cysteine cluster protein [[Eubacterium] cellulosolvens]
MKWYSAMLRDGTISNALSSVNSQVKPLQDEDYLKRMGYNMTFCDKNHCMDCCFEPKVPLLNEDIGKIVMYGYYDAYFVDEHNGIKTLRTRDDGTCVFFNKQSRECEIYNSRPARCRLNPYCICEDNLEPHIDETCKFHNICNDDPEMHERMSEYLVTLEKEIEWRRRTGHFY